MAEDRPSVNHLIRTGLCQPLGVDQRLVKNESVDGHGVSQQNKSLKLNQRAEVCKINLSTSRSNMKSSELDSQSSSLLPDVRHINGFYTIADTLHKENANSAVTVTTQSQMGEVRMSSRVAEPLSLKHGLVVHSEWDQKNFNNVQGQTKQAVESNAFTNPLKEITDCVEHITLLDDDDFNGNVEMSGNLELQEMSQFGNDTSLCLSVDTESLLPSHDNKQSIDQTRTERALDTEKKREEIPENISEFVLGHDRGKSHLAMQVPLDDSDLDRILPAGFENAIELVRYQSELQMPDIMKLITKDLSEPYSIYTYRYFIHNWPSLCFLAMDGSLCVGAIVCKLDVHKKVIRRGYIAMLAVDENYRKQKIGSSLVRKAIRAMIRSECDEVVLETEITNKPALRLYENLGFSRDKRLFRYYLNGVDALRLKLWLR